jgi:hypothetical protein
MYELSQLTSNIFYLKFKDTYDLCMHFLRYQEFYECPSSDFRDKSWCILDYIKWYSKKYGNGSFTYMVDWAGFNIPGSVIKKVSELGIPDINKYDLVMQDIYQKCLQQSNEDFYLIGSTGSVLTLKHEIAHGFFSSNKEYKKQMTQLVNELPLDFKLRIFESLKKIGYTRKVYIDECQAYFCTGLIDEFNNLFKEFKISSSEEIKIQKPFILIFNKYFKKLINQS